MQPKYKTCCGTKSETPWSICIVESHDMSHDESCDESHGGRHDESHELVGAHFFIVPV